MEKYVNNLEYLCIEVISQNIQFLSKNFKNKLDFCWNKKLSENIFLSAISHSYNNGFNQNSVEFLFENF